MAQYEVHRPTVNCTQEEKRTKQAPAAAADINTLAERYIRKNQPPLPKDFPKYGDFSNVDNFLDAQLKVVAAAEAFGALPSRIRNRFENDPTQLLEFLQDPANQEEAVSLGLAEKPEPAPAGGEDPPAPPPPDPPPGD